MPHTYLLDARVWKTQGPRAWAAAGGLGPAATSDWLHRGAGEEAYTGGGQAGSVPSPGTQRGTPWCTTPFLPTTQSGHCSQSHFSDGKTEAGKGSVPSDLAVDEGL